MINRDKRRYIKLHVSMVLMIILSFPCFINAQTTGKIAGQVTDAADGSPLVGANVIVVGTQLGAAAALDGYYFIINVPPGTYTISLIREISGSGSFWFWLVQVGILEVVLIF